MTGGFASGDFDFAPTPKPQTAGEFVCPECRFILKTLLRTPSGVCTDCA